MARLENKLTVDDLIVKYMIEKVKLGYEPQYTIEEFFLFLHYFQQYIEVLDVTYNSDKLFDRFFERKFDDWSVMDGKEFPDGKRILVPHIERREDDILVATNKLSYYDERILNIDKKEEKYISNIIASFLQGYPRRMIDTDTSINEEELQIGQSIAALFVNSIWREYCRMNIATRRWPKQCCDINKYLLETDLAEVIELPSIRQDVLAFYSDVSKRIAVMAQNDPLLQIRSTSNPYLPYSNYANAIQYHDILLEWCKFCTFDVRLEDKMFDVVYWYPKHEDNISLNSRNVKKLVRALNLNVNKNK